jgi:hypothetical protein
MATRNVSLAPSNVAAGVSRVFSISAESKRLRKPQQGSGLLAGKFNRDGDHGLDSNAKNKAERTLWLADSKARAKSTDANIPSASASVILRRKERVPANRTND